MSVFSEIELEEFLDRFTLIVGEVNRGKTALTQRILESYCRERSGRVAVIDLAPTLSTRGARRNRVGKGVGGRLQIPVSSAVRSFHGLIHAPRLSAKDAGEAQALAEENARTIEGLFRQADPGADEALFINDCSLFLHAGDPGELLTWIRRAGTSVVNGYYGRALGEGRLTVRERRGMGLLMAQCDRLIHL